MGLFKFNKQRIVSDKITRYLPYDTNDINYILIDLSGERGTLYILFDSEKARDDSLKELDNYFDDKKRTERNERKS